MNIMDDKIYKSHSALSKTLSDFGSKLGDVSNDVSKIKMEASQHTSEHAVLNLKLDDINEKLENFITIDQFWPVKTLVYGFLTIILITIIGYSLDRIFSNNTTHAQTQVQTK